MQHYHRDPKKDHNFDNPHIIPTLPLWPVNSTYFRQFGAVGVSEVQSSVVAQQWSEHHRLDLWFSLFAGSAETLTPEPSCLDPSPNTAARVRT